MRKTKNRLLSIIIAIAFMITAVPAFTLTFPAADEDKTYPSIRTELGLTNGQFDTTYTTFPVSPDGWTGAFLNGSANQNVSSMKNGIVDLDNVLALNEKNALKLDGNTFAGGENLPGTIFGYNQNLYPGTNTKALMINSDQITTAYGYTSNSLTLEPNKHYEFRVWVMTGSFDSETGAFIRLKSNESTKLDLTFGPIDTSSKTTDKGWREYRFYVENSSYSSLSVSLSLQLGNFVAENKDENIDLVKNLTNGVAFFDNISAYTISKQSYELIAESDRGDDVIVHSLKDYVDYNYSAGEYNDYNNPESAFGDNDFELGKVLNSHNWKKSALGGGANSDILNTSNFESYKKNADGFDDNPYNLNENPHSPFGGTNILMLSNNSIAGTYNAVSSKPFTIMRHRTYRLSIWYKTDNISIGNAIVKVKESVADEKDKVITDKDITCITTAGDDYYRGWNEAVVYIRGSAVKDTKLELELILGTKSAVAEGIVFFDDFNLEYVDTSEFETVATDVFSLDTTTYDENNSSFNLAGAYKDYQYPLLPKVWKGDYAGSETLTRPGTKAPENKDIITGIIGTDNAHFDANKINYGAGAINPDNGLYGHNMLYIYSDKPTAYGYVSPSYTIDANQYRTLTVKLYTQITSGGANLVLRSGSTVLSVISDITDNGYYTFVIEGGASAKTVELELWLGVSDGKENDTKLASGHVFVDYVQINNTETSPADINTYKAAASAPKTARFSFLNENFEAFEEGDNYYKTPYTWSFVTNTKNNIHGAISKAGIIDSKDITSNSELAGIGFIHGNEESPYAMMINNPAPGAAYMKNSINFSLAADSRYRIKIRVQTIGIRSRDAYINGVEYLKDKDGNVIKDMKGVPKIDYSKKDMKNAGVTLKLTGKSGGEFKSINTERGIKEGDKNGYQDYFFYVKTGTEATDIGFELWLGNDQYIDMFTSGYAFFDNITLLSISETDYNDSVKILDDEKDLNEDKKTVHNIVKIEMGADEPEKPDEKPAANPFPWWGVPSIIFGVAILAAIIGVVARKVGPKIAKKFKKKKQATGADHNRTLETIHAKNMDKIRREKLESLTGGDSYNDEDFDGGDVNASGDGATEKAPEKAKPESEDDLKQFDE